MFVGILKKSASILPNFDSVLVHRGAHTGLLQRPFFLHLSTKYFPPSLPRQPPQTESLKDCSRGLLLGKWEHT